MFSESSDQNASNKKTRIFFSKNVDWEIMDSIGDILGCQLTKDLCKYLGVLILHKKS